MRIGGLFYGYGGLDRAVEQVMGGDLAWYSEIDPGACRIAAHHHPDTPNLGDITAIDWQAVEPVDVLTGGFPCQDVSHAGKRAGLGDGTRTGLWSHMAHAVDVLRPRYVIAENVRGLLSARADSDVEPCPWCLGEGDDEPPMRALGALLADLAELGYDARWVGLRAADVGAPHGRFRVFIVARDTARRDGQHDGRTAATSGNGYRAIVGRTGSSVAADTADVRHERTRPAWDGRGGSTDGGRATPDADDTRPQGTEPAQRRDLPAWGATPDAECQRRDRRALNARRGQVERGAIAGSGRTDWGDYGPAIRRWETVIGRPAPAPTQPGRTGNPQLSPRFVEWLMGLPEGHVTEVPGLTRNQQLKALGNGVVPQQAAAALTWLLTQEAAA